MGRGGRPWEVKGGELDQNAHSVLARPCSQVPNDQKATVIPTKRYV